MAWVSVHQQLRDHRKVRELYRLLNISRQEAVGILVLMWLWALDNADRQGMILSATIDDIAEAAFWKGDSQKLYSALVESHWIDEVEGKMYFHDWDEFNKPFFDYIDRKERDKIRKRQGNSAGKSTEIPAENPQEFHESPSPSPSPSPKKNIKDYSLEFEKFRQRYDAETLKKIDQYLDILRTTRVSGKISDSIKHQVYEEMNKHPVVVVKYACETVIKRPELHSKKENYFYGIMRNTTADEAEQKLNNGQQSKSKYRDMTNYQPGE